MLGILGVIASMLIIWRACDYFEDATSYLGRNMSEGVKGATFNAIGSSIPELLTASIALLYYGNTEGFSFGVATTAGSAIFNSAIIPSLVILVVILSGVANQVNVSKRVMLRDGLYLIGAEILLIKLLDGPITFVTGLILLGYYGFYMFNLLTSGRGEFEAYEGRQLGNKKAIVMLLGATAVIGGACHLLVESCYMVGETFNIQTYFVAVVLASAATSVPDTILSIKDAKNGEYDDAVANALGSNIFDICVCTGLPLAVYTFLGGKIVISSENITELRTLLLLSTIMIFFLLFIGKIGIKKAIAILGVYICFIGYIVGKVYNNELALDIGRFLRDLI